MVVRVETVHVEQRPVQELEIVDVAVIRRARVEDRVPRAGMVGQNVERRVLRRPPLPEIRSVDGFDGCVHCDQPLAFANDQVRREVRLNDAASGAVLGSVEVPFTGVRPVAAGHQVHEDECSWFVDLELLSQRLEFRPPLEHVREEMCVGSVADSVDLEGVDGVLRDALTDCTGELHRSHLSSGSRHFDAAAMDRFWSDKLRNSEPLVGALEVRHLNRSPAARRRAASGQRRFRAARPSTAGTGPVGSSQRPVSRSTKR